MKNNMLVIYEKETKEDPCFRGGAGMGLKQKQSLSAGVVACEHSASKRRVLFY
jgi:hypothetical protein